MRLFLSRFDESLNRDMIVIEDDRATVWGMVHVDAFRGNDELYRRLREVGHSYVTLTMEVRHDTTTQSMD